MVIRKEVLSLVRLKVPQNWGRYSYPEHVQDCTGVRGYPPMTSCSTDLTTKAFSSDDAAGKAGRESG